MPKAEGRMMDRLGQSGVPISVRYSLWPNSVSFWLFGSPAFGPFPRSQRAPVAAALWSVFKRRSQQQYVPCVPCVAVVSCTLQEFLKPLTALPKKTIDRSLHCTHESPSCNVMMCCSQYVSGRLRGHGSLIGTLAMPIIRPCRSILERLYYPQC